MKRVYLASPFFNDEQIRRVERMEKLLRSKGLNVFSPREHQNDHLPFGSKEWREATFTNDLKHIGWCDLIVAIYNEEDAGTMWELGMGYTQGVPLIVFNEDGKETLNLMISDSLHAYIESWEDMEKYDFETLPRIEYTGNVI